MGLGVDITREPLESGSYLVITSSIFGDGKGLLDDTRSVTRSVNYANRVEVLLRVLSIMITGEICPILRFHVSSSSRSLLYRLFGTRTPKSEQVKISVHTRNMVLPSLSTGTSGL